MTSKKPLPDNPAQSARFEETVRELAAAGDLDPIAADRQFEAAFKRIVPAKKRPAKDN